MPCYGSVRAERAVHAWSRLKTKTQKPGLDSEIRDPRRGAALFVFKTRARTELSSPLFSFLSLYSIMDELVSKVVGQLGLDEKQAKQAFGALLAFIKTHVGDDFDFSGLLAKIPGAETTLRDAEADDNVPTSGTKAGPNSLSIVGIVTWFLETLGVMDILKKLLSTFFGENAVQMLDSAKDGAELVTVMDKLGITKEQGIKMAKMLVDLVKYNVGPETVDKLAAQVPALRALLGDTKKDE